MAVDLVERITTAPRLPYEGLGYRQQAPTYDPLSGEGARIHGGRFNPPDGFPVLYLCSTRECAAAEFVRTTQRHPLGPAAFLPRVLYRYDVHLTAVLDLTDEATLEHLGLVRGALVDEDVTVPRLIGEVADRLGYQAVRNASAASVDDVVAVLVQNLRTGVLVPSVEATWNSFDALGICENARRAGPWLSYDRVRDVPGGATR